MFNKINIKLDDSHNVCNGHLQTLWLLNRLISEAKHYGSLHGQDEIKPCAGLRPANKVKIVWFWSYSECKGSLNQANSFQG